MPSAGGSFEPRPLARDERTGKAREVGPGARRPPSDRKAEKPSWKGVAHMHKLFSGLVAGIALLAAAPAALAADVAVRVEGTGDTLVPRSTVSTFGGSFTKGGGGTCPGSSAGGALERATAGDWSGRWASFGDYEVQTIKGETHASAAGDASGTYWAFWVNYRPASAGVCGTPAQEGDDFLFFPSCFGRGCDREPTPLRIASIPSSAQPGQPFDVRVVQYAVTFGGPPDYASTTSEAPAAGATVTAAGRDFTADSAGVAHVTVDARSLAAVRAQKAGYVRSASEPVCVDCGQAAPPPPARDTTAPATSIRLRDGAVFSRRRAPRLLRGRVAADPSGLHSVKLRLTRRVGRRCSYFSGRRERFVPMRCGHGSFLRIGDRADWSYLLPKRLGRGRYVLEAKAIDGAFNRGAPARVRFRVK